MSKTSRRGLHCPPNILNTPIEDLAPTGPCWQQPISNDGKQTRDLIQKCSEIDPIVTLVESDETLTIDEAAAFLGRTAQTLRNWEKEGRLLPIRDAQNRRRYTQKQLMPLRKEQMSPPEIVIPDIQIGRLKDIFGKLFAGFEETDQVTLTIQIDKLEGLVRFSVDSQDGLKNATKAFRIEDHE